MPWENVGQLRGPEGQEGPEGPEGPQGTDVRVMGTVPNKSLLPSPGTPGELWFDADGNLWAWNAILTLNMPPNVEGMPGDTLIVTPWNNSMPNFRHVAFTLGLQVPGNQDLRVIPDNNITEVGTGGMLTVPQLSDGDWRVTRRTSPVINIGEEYGTLTIVDSPVTMTPKSGGVGTLVTLTGRLTEVSRISIKSFPNTGTSSIIETFVSQTDTEIQFNIAVTGQRLIEGLGSISAVPIVGFGVFG